MKEYRISAQAHELPRGGMPWRSLWWLAALAALSACAYSGTGCPDGSGRVRVWGDRCEAQKLSGTQTDAVWRVVCP